jgi:hypothetical protein
MTYGAEMKPQAEKAGNVLFLIRGDGFPNASGH